jgi:hypothetical protein
MRKGTVVILESMFRSEFDSDQSKGAQAIILNAAIDTLGILNNTVLEMITDFNFEHQTSFNYEKEA